MLSLEQLFRLMHFSSCRYDHLAKQFRQPDVIIVHKSVHDAYDYKQHWADAGVPLDFFLQELQDRAELLATALASKFPKAMRIWRDAYYDWTGDVESMYVRMRRTLNPVFEKQGFLVLSGYNLSQHGIPGPDGRHQHVSVKQVVNQVIYNLVCD
jgi:hypothetical protein